MVNPFLLGGSSQLVSGQRTPLKTTRTLLLLTLVGTLVTAHFPSGMKHQVLDSIFNHLLSGMILQVQIPHTSFNTKMVLKWSNDLDDLGYLSSKPPNLPCPISPQRVTPFDDTVVSGPDEGFRGAHHVAMSC